MKDQKSKNIFKIILGGACIVIVIIFFFTFFLVLAVNNLQKENIRALDQLPETDNSLKVYVVSGKIIDIQDKTIILKTPVFDFVNKRWDKDKKEIRKLIIDSKTELIKNGYDWDEKKKRFETVSNIARFEDFKIGDFISANYSENVIKIKDFSPTTITILPN